MTFPFAIFPRTPPAGGNDAFTKILLHMDGTNGGTTFTDSNAGGSAHTWTATGATTVTATPKFGTAAGSFNGSNQYISTPDHADFTLGSGDWTFDVWFYVSGGSGTRRFMFGPGNSAGSTTSLSIYAQLTTANKIQCSAAQGGSSVDVLSTSTFTTTGYHHLEFSRSGSVLRMFLDGVQEGGDVAIAGSVNDSSNNWSLGRLGEYPSDTWNGLFDEVRLSVGIARHTANFTPPSAAYF